jgi:hypothetical protein
MHLSVLFSDRAEAHLFPELVRKSPAKLALFKQTCRLVFQDDLERKTDLILSAEGIGFKFTKEEMIAMRSKLLRHFDRVRILNYIRPIKTLAASDFQQRVKGGLNEFMLPPPRYRARSEPWMNVFGRENCDFRLFDRKSLLSGDVIDDFLEYVKINPSNVKKNVANESMSLESTALMFAHNVFGAAFFGRFNKDQLRQWILPGLRHFGERKFGFSESLLQTHADGHIKDIEWMSQVCGFDTTGSAPSVDEPVTGVDHLLSIAYDTLPKAREAVEKWRDEEAKSAIQFRRQKAAVNPAASRVSGFGIARRTIGRLLHLKRPG